MEVKNELMAWVETPKCPFCGLKDELYLPVASIAAWVDGMLIQDAFPKMSAEMREHLKTGIHPQCWIDKLGADEDDDEEDASLPLWRVSINLYAPTQETAMQVAEAAFSRLAEEAYGGETLDDLWGFTWAVKSMGVS